MQGPDSQSRHAIMFNFGNYRQLHSIISVYSMRKAIETVINYLLLLKVMQSIS